MGRKPKKILNQIMTDDDIKKLVIDDLLHFHKPYTADMDEEAAELQAKIYEYIQKKK